MLGLWELSKEQYSRFLEDREWLVCQSENWSYCQVTFWYLMGYFLSLIGLLFFKDKVAKYHNAFVLSIHFCPKMLKCVGNSDSGLSFCYFGSTVVYVYSVLSHAFARAACLNFLFWQKQNENALMHLHCAEYRGYFSAFLGVLPY